MKNLQPTAWKVGELAKRTGLSMRTLHYYDEIGLLSPSRRTEADHRLYAAHDIVRLQQIKSLRHLGFGLEEIRGLPGPARLSFEPGDRTASLAAEGADRTAAEGS